MGDHPIGLFMFDGDGNYSVQLTNPADKEAAYVATWGTYVVDEDAETFTLTPQGAIDPTLIGTAILRYVEFLDDVAVFHTPTQTVDGVEMTTYITWRKQA